MERGIASTSVHAFESTFLGRLSGKLDLSVAITGRAGEILWLNGRILDEFPGVFHLGRSIEEALEEATSPDALGYPYLIGPAGEEIAARVLRGGSLRRSRMPGSNKVYRHFQVSVDCADDEDDPDSLQAHCLQDISPEKQLFETYRNNLHQLSSMKEIIDLLYRSLSTSEVLNLILVAITARQGFGFNRGFFLEVSGQRLRGRLGIGPDSVEEAHRIWTRLAESSSSLGETLRHLKQADTPPDPATQALALQMDLPLEDRGVMNGVGGVIQACRERRPALVIHSASLPEAEERLFQILGVDTLAAVPLSIQGRLAGVLLADNFITRRPISGDDLELLKTFSGYAALALERSSLHDELTRNLEKLRRANRELQTNHQRLLKSEKLSALGEMAARVSHEIRNPLVAIGGLARSILGDEIESEETRQVLNIIVNEVQRLERFLNETLGFVKPTAGSPQKVDLADLVNDVLHTFREDIQRAELELVPFLPGEPVVVSVDPDLLRGALSNLIKNAREVLEPGGRIRVALQSNGGVAEIEVADTGPGIPEEIREMIFEPFFTTKKDGTGIGLAVTRQNIRTLGGTLCLDSAPPYQTLFRIKLPLEVTEVESRGHEKESADNR